MEKQNWEIELSYKPVNVYEKLTAEEVVTITQYAEGYKVFLDNAKIEREAVKEAIRLAEDNGYVAYTFGDRIEKGGKYYYNNRGKGLCLFRVGSESIENGARIVAAHIDSPRIDLKPRPLYEDGQMAFLKTHYYGGIKKYQWTAIPLALHGTVAKTDGTTVDITIGEDFDDPIFYINDLLPHLAKDQVVKSASEVINGEQLNILIGSVPYNDDTVKERIKTNILSILHEKYDIKESDFLSAELCAVPAMKARDVGLDRSLIAAYGHDDRVCAYPALTALLETTDEKNTLMVILADKEETGSGGNTGIKSSIYFDILEEITAAEGANYRLVKSKTQCLSADVNAAFDPNFAEVYERRNSSYINNGVVVTKYTGSRGKSGTSDASAEFFAKVRKILEEHDIVWQPGELGKVDQGGGGTVAVYISEQNVDVIDIGVAVISMHAPYEVISKADLYMTHKLCQAFYEA